MLPENILVRGTDKKDLRKRKTWERAQRQLQPIHQSMSCCHFLHRHRHVNRVYQANQVYRVNQVILVVMNCS